MSADIKLGAMSRAYFWERFDQAFAESGIQGDTAFDWFLYEARIELGHRERPEARPSSATFVKKARDEKRDISLETMEAIARVLGKPCSYFLPPEGAPSAVNELFASHPEWSDVSKAVAAKNKISPEIMHKVAMSTCPARRGEPLLEVTVYAQAGVFLDWERMRPPSESPPPPDSTRSSAASNITPIRRRKRLL